MAKTSTLNIRIDQKAKTEAENLFANFGITISDAVNMFIHQSIIDGGLPFNVKLKTPNAQTIEAMKEADLISHNPNIKGYTDIDEMMREILS